MDFDLPQSSQPKAQVQDSERLCARVTALTDVGRKRKNNEDNYLVLPLDGEVLRQGVEGFTFALDGPGLLLAVADGMGGHQSGEVASRLCVETLGGELVKLLQEQNEPRDAALGASVEATHKLIFDASQKDAGLEGMGCTLTAVLLTRRQAWIAQVGDSRAYLFRDGQLAQLTEDQTVGNLLRATEGSHYGDRVNDILTQAMGAQENLSPVTSAAPLQSGDTLLICCDGLYKIVSNPEIAAILAWEAPLHAKAERLIEQANQNGGPDNITVVLAQVSPRS